MSNEYEQYRHHDATVWVDKELKGKHRDHCLCWNCEDFEPNSDTNCEVARHLYELCVRFCLVTPVYECPEFREK